MRIAVQPKPRDTGRMQNYKQQFFELAMARGNLKFGEFTLKSGRISPYFFNAGGFDDGQSLQLLYYNALTVDINSLDWYMLPLFRV